MYILKVMLKYFWVKKMRLRNNPNALEIIKNSPNFISNPESYKGRWNSFFKNDNPIEIEIGMGKGNFIIKKAKENKNINYIGIEKYNSVLVQAVKKLGEEKIEKAKKSDRPAAIIAKTIKGKGVSFMENNAGWHGKAPGKDDFERAMAELK